eukprot:9857381-Alexandrium_andersonii.AAC.1
MPSAPGPPKPGRWLCLEGGPPELPGKSPQPLHIVFRNSAASSRRSGSAPGSPRSSLELPPSVGQHLRVGA